MPVLRILDRCSLVREASSGTTIHLSGASSSRAPIFPREGRDSCVRVSVSTLTAAPGEFRLSEVMDTKSCSA